MQPAGRFYISVYRITFWILNFFYRYRFVHSERLGTGAAILCANHSSWLDPFFLAHAAGSQSPLHLVAKRELFRIPLVRGILNRLQMIPVTRAMADLQSVKLMLGYLKSGDRIAIFPEGTRVSSDDAVAAKTGAVRIAERAGVPVVPVYIPRRKRLFRPNLIIFGEPYRINEAREKLEKSDYYALADALMVRIGALGTEIGG